MTVETFCIAKFEVPVRLPMTVRFGEHGEPICPPADPAEAPAAAPAQIAVPAIVDARATA